MESRQDNFTNIKDKEDTRFKIYVSHVPADAVHAEELYQYLRNTLGQHNDLRIYGTRGSPYTEGSKLWSKWVSEVQSGHTIKALRSCEVFILLVSRNSIVNGGLLNELIGREFIEARNFKRNIICLFIEDKKYFPESLIQRVTVGGDQITLIFPEDTGVGINFTALFEILERYGARIASPVVDDGKDYDVFISCKSEDNKFAKNVCNFLQSRGLKVFFGKETLPKLGSAAYRRQITKAIDNSRHMVVVTSRSDHVNSKWVEFEWGLFLDEQLAERKDGNLLTVLAGGMTVKELPIDLRNVEAIPLVPGEIERLVEYLRPHPPRDAAGVEVNGAGPATLDEITPETADPSRFVRIEDFMVDKKEFLKNISWSVAYEHAEGLSAGSEREWKLPTIHQLKMIRNMAIFPDKYCYWSSEELRNKEVRYLHFDDGHEGTGPKSFDKGLCAVFIQNDQAKQGKTKNVFETEPDIMYKLMSEHYETVVIAFSILKGKEKDIYFGKLVEKLSSPSAKERIAAIHSLFWCRYKDLPLHLMPLAKDESPSVRRRVASYLGALRYKNALSVINELCFDKSPDVRAAARGAYEKITGQKLASGDGM